MAFASFNTVRSVDVPHADLRIPFVPQVLNTCARKINELRGLRGGDLGTWAELPSAPHPLNPGVQASGEVAQLASRGRGSSESESDGC
jgi:hypothetical protein